MLTKLKAVNRFVGKGNLSDAKLRSIISGIDCYIAYPSIWAHHGLVLCALATSIFAVWAHTNWVQVVLSVSLFDYLQFDIPILVIIPFVLITWLILLGYNSKFEANSERLEFYTGLVSFKRKSFYRRWTDIRGFRVEQSILDRFFKTGSIVCLAIGEQLEVPGLNDVECVQKDIERILEHIIAEEKDKNGEPSVLDDLAAYDME